MTKLSERLPSPSYDRSIQGWRDWLKELAEYVEFIERRDRLAYRDLRKRLDGISKPVQEAESEYEPRTYDEAIALCKGWKRSVIGSFVCWENPKWTIKGIYGHQLTSWEKDKWPELWKELNKTKRNGHLYFYSDRWLYDFTFVSYRESTSGRVVCKAYLDYKGHADWAERLSKETADAD